MSSQKKSSLILDQPSEFQQSDANKKENSVASSQVIQSADHSGNIPKDTINKSKDEDNQ